jgi:hypothetical protein
MRFYEVMPVCIGNVAFAWWPVAEWAGFDDDCLILRCSKGMEVTAFRSSDDPTTILATQAGPTTVVRLLLYGLSRCPATMRAGQLTIAEKGCSRIIFILLNLGTTNEADQWLSPM